jgi:hypothetical protein
VKWVIPVINHGIFKQVTNPAISIFNPFPKQRLGKKKLEKIKWCIGQGTNMKIARLHDERAETGAAGLIGRKFISPGRLLRARARALVLLAEAFVIIGINFLSLIGI